MRFRSFWPVAAILRAVNAPGAVPPVPCSMQKALASIERLDRLAGEKLARARARDVEMELVVDDLVAHR
jgi:hypothetical protein